MSIYILIWDKIFLLHKPLIAKWLKSILAFHPNRWIWSGNLFTQVYVMSWIVVWTFHLPPALINLILFLSNFTSNRERFELMCDEDQSLEKDMFAKLLKIAPNEADIVRLSKGWAFFNRISITFGWITPIKTYAKIIINVLNVFPLALWVFWYGWKW